MERFRRREAGAGGRYSMKGRKYSIEMLQRGRAQRVAVTREFSGNVASKSTLE